MAAADAGSDRWSRELIPGNESLILGNESLEDEKMKILIVRHGEPDYSIDSLTEKGWKEAEYLSERMAQIETKEYYVSPLGRAKATASPTLKKTGRTAIELPWLREFHAPIWKPNIPEEPSCTWDWIPGDWTPEEKYFHHDQWWDTPIMRDGDVKKEYDWVITNLDNLLKEHGYEREGYYYRAVQPNNDTIVFFCHFALECVLLSHLLNISPMALWHGTCAAPSSVTTVVTEERREGIAYFRMSSFADVSHLYHHGEPPSFMARFCECYANEDERHD